MIQQNTIASSHTQPNVQVSPHTTLTAEQLENIRIIAIKMLGEIGGNIKNLQADITAPVNDGQAWSGEIADIATICADNPVAMSRLPNNTKFARRLTDTIIRIQEGKFDDHCVSCREVIPFERLLDQPGTRQCFTCKNELDK